MILSASRRTDIPGYYSEWFINRLKAGYVLTRNPMNHAQVSRIILSPEIIDCIVFWTKDPENMLEKLPELEKLGYRYYFQFTLTPYGKEIERNLRHKQDIIATFKRLSEMLGKDRVLWRYDPIIINQSLTPSYHKEMFSGLCQELQGYTSICTISFVDIYHKLSNAAANSLISEISLEQMQQIAASFAAVAGNYAIEVRACSETVDLAEFGIRPASCIDRETIERICGNPVREKRDKCQRQGCGCLQSVDIGVYNTCNNGCIYCYANHSDKSILSNFLKHNPGSDIMIGEVLECEKITDRKN
jgi:Domain of unknown function (DUF1848).